MCEKHPVSWARTAAAGDDSRRSGEAGRRGQTTLDFAVGMSVFVGIVLFVFLFVPGIIEPFTTGAQDETVTSNRVADDLTQKHLAAPEAPGVLHQHCTVIFFNQSAPTGPNIDACGFDDAYNATGFLGLERRQQVNVTIYGNVSSDRGSDLLCWDDGNERLVELDDSPGDCDVRFAAGDRPRQRNVDAVSATRVALLAGEDVTVEVEMW